MAETVKGRDREQRKTYSPAVDIIETKNHILLTADMPGVDEKTVEVTIEKNLLTIHGMIDSTIHDNLQMESSEYGTGDYRRVFSLSDEIDRDNIKATVKNGLLKLVLPKAENARTKKIQVHGEA